MIKKTLRWFEKNKYLSYLLLLIIAIFIFYMSSQSFYNGIGPEFAIKPYLYHYGIYFLLSLFLVICLVNGKYKHFIFFCIILAIFYGLSDEFHQLFVPNRSCEFGDFMTDSTGVISGAVFYIANTKFKKY
jgi:hypothetical protein